MKAGDYILFMSELSGLHTVLSQSIHSINVVEWINWRWLGEELRGWKGQQMIQYDACVFCAQSRLTLSEPVNCSPAGSSVHGIFQARILEWVSISFSRWSSQPRHWTLLPWQADSLPPGKPHDACRFNKFSLCPQSASIILKCGEMGIIFLLGSLQIYISPQSFSHIKRAFFSTLKT